MVCFPCLSPNRKRLKRPKGSIDSVDHENKSSWSGGEMRRNAHSFDLKELSVATENFKESNLIGKDGFGKVFKGFLENQEVAIKKFNRDAMQGNEEFLKLTVLHHPNLVNLIGYCDEGEERLLVYEYMSRGSLDNHLFDLRHGQEPLSWNTRVKIALGAAKGLAYLHDVADPPVIYRDLKSSNILLDENFNSKLSDFGLARLGPVGEDTDVSTTVMGTHGYCAPDYAQSGKPNVNSDVYSFGVVLLELISGRRVFEFSLGTGTESLIEWSRPFFNDRSRFTQLADPLLQGRYPLRGFYQLVSLISMCLHDRAEIRPFMVDVVSALKYVASQPYGIDIGCNIPSAHTS